MGRSGGDRVLRRNDDIIHIAGIGSQDQVPNSLRSIIIFTIRSNQTGSGEI